MIFYVEAYSAWLSEKVLREHLSRFEVRGIRRSTQAKRSWKCSRKSCQFIRIISSQTNERFIDCIGQISRAFNIAPKACISFIRGELERRKGIVAVECKDGIFVPPAVLGPVLWKLRRVPRTKFWRSRDS